MSLNNKIYLFTILSLTTAALGYNYTKQVLLPPNILDVEFSPDQKYLVATSDKYLQLYNGVTGNIISHIIIPS